MIDSLTVSAYSVASEQRCFVEPPNNLETLPAKQLLTFGCCLTCLGTIWLGVTISLYNVTVEHYISLVYEARWLPGVILLCGLVCLLLIKFKLESLYICCATTCVYTCACCQVVFIVYAVNLHRTFPVDDVKSYPEEQNDLSFSTIYNVLVNSKPLAQSRLYYGKLCTAMCIVCLAGLIMVILVIWQLCRIAATNYVYTTLSRSLSKYLYTSGTVFLCLSLFSCYFAFQVLSLPFSYVHTYMIQELLCALTLFLQTVLQFILIFRPNRLLLKALLVFNILQFIQETFYSWNSYYISLYIHSSKAKLAVDINYDQTVMTVNFIAHFVRAILCAYESALLASALDASLQWAVPDEKLHLNVTIQKFTIGITCVFLFLAICHVALDIYYTSMVHIYRTLIAFTGISVLYLAMIGISLSYYIHHKAHMALVLATVFVLLTLSVSAHGLYVYVDSSMSKMLLQHLETLGRDKVQPSIMHFAEGLLAFISFCASLISSFLLFRIMHMQSVRVAKERGSGLSKSMAALRYCSMVLLVLNTVEAMINAAIRQNWQLFDNTIAYNVLDIISMYVLQLFQFYISMDSNSHFTLSLIALFFMLLFEVLTTFNYLGSYTKYMQLLIVVNRLSYWMFDSALSDVKTSAKAPSYSADYGVELNAVMPLSELSLLLINHAIQLIQWALTIVSIILVSVILELLIRRDRQIRLDRQCQQLSNQCSTIDCQMGYVNEAVVFP